MTDLDIIKSISHTFAKAGCDLSEDQKALLSGCLMFWFGEIRAQIKTRTKETLQEAYDVFNVGSGGCER